MACDEVGRACEWESSIRIARPVKREDRGVLYVYERDQEIARCDDGIDRISKGEREKEIASKETRNAKTVQTRD